MTQDNSQPEGKGSPKEQLTQALFGDEAEMGGNVAEVLGDEVAARQTQQPDDGTVREPEVGKELREASSDSEETVTLKKSDLQFTFKSGENEVGVDLTTPEGREDAQKYGNFGVDYNKNNQALAVERETMRQQIKEEAKVQATELFSAFTKKSSIVHEDSTVEDAVGSVFGDSEDSQQADSDSGGTRNQTPLERRVASLEQRERVVNTKHTLESKVKLAFDEAAEFFADLDVQDVPWKLIGDAVENTGLRPIQAFKKEHPEKYLETIRGGLQKGSIEEGEETSSTEEETTEEAPPVVKIRPDQSSEESGPNSINEATQELKARAEAGEFPVEILFNEDL